MARYQVLSSTGERMGVYPSPAPAINRANHLTATVGGVFTVERHETLYTTRTIDRRDIEQARRIAERDRAQLANATDAGNNPAHYY